MTTIKLFNRYGAILYLEKDSQIEPNIYKWNLKVDNKHEWVLEHMRIIGNYPEEIDAVDPAGGPFISIGDEFDNKYKIIKIINSTTFIISEKWEQ